MNTQGLVDYIEETMVERYKQKALVSEVDFIAGASAAIQYILAGPEDDALTDEIPPTWIFFAMAGRSIVAERMKQNGEQPAFVAEVEKRQNERGYRLAKLDEMVDFLKKIYEMRDATPYWIYSNVERLLEDMMEIDTLEEDNG